MKTESKLITMTAMAALCGLTLLGGCGGGSSSSSGDSAALPDVPTQAEADAAAAAEINADNADQELADLQKEIEQESGGGG